jgi:hypothetical protein
MNQWDRDNLEFLMNSSPAVLKDFLSQADEDDISYVMELINVARTNFSEIVVNSMEYGESADRNDTEFPIAIEVLSKFTLKG